MSNRSPIVQVDQREVCGVDAGSGPPLLWVHGFPLDHRLWEHQLDFFSQQYRVICPDLPGFGRSQMALELESVADVPLTDAVWSLADVSDWLVRLLDTLQVDQPVTYIGLSMGGYIGWEFARRHPGRLQRLVGCHTRAADDTETVRRGRRMAAAEVFSKGLEPLAEGMLPKLFGDSARQSAGQEPVAAPVRAGIESQIRSTAQMTIAAAQWAMSIRNDARQWQASIDVPTLLVAGEFDEITPPGEMQDDAERMPDVDLVTLPQAAHLSPWECPDRFNSVLKEWLMR